MSDTENKTEGDNKSERGIERTSPCAKKRGPAPKLVGSGWGKEWLCLWRCVAEGRAEIRGQRSESRCNFSSQDAGNEAVQARNCPEIRSEMAEGSSLKAKVRNDEECIVLIGGVGEDTAVGQRGNLTLDLTLNHNLVRDPRKPRNVRNGVLALSMQGDRIE